MANLIQLLQNKKTYILSGIGVLSVLVRFLTGEVGFMEFVNSPQFVELINYLGLATLRAGVGKIKQ